MAMGRGLELQPRQWTYGRYTTIVCLPAEFGTDADCERGIGLFGRKSYRWARQRVYCDISVCADATCTARWSPRHVRRGDTAGDCTGAGGKRAAGAAHRTSFMAIL